MASSPTINQHPSSMGNVTPVYAARMDFCKKRKRKRTQRRLKKSRVAEKTQTSNRRSRRPETSLQTKSEKSQLVNVMYDPESKDPNDAAEDPQNATDHLPIDRCREWKVHQAMQIVFVAELDRRTSKNRGNMSSDSTKCS